MPSIHIPSHHKKTTLREMLKKYLPSSEEVSEDAPAGVRYIRNLAKRLLEQAGHKADQTFDESREHIVGKPIFKFINEEWTRAMKDAERENNGRITEADLASRIPDDITQKLSDELQQGINEAIQDIT